MLNGDLQAKLLQAPDQAVFSRLTVAFVEVGEPQLLVGLCAGQHVGDDDEDAVAGGDDGALAPTLGGEAVILGREVGVFGMPAAFHAG